MLFSGKKNYFLIFGKVYFFLVSILNKSFLKHAFVYNFFFSSLS